MDTLAFPFEIKSINDAGLIDGLAAAHSNVDYGGDRFIPGAFAKSLASSATVPMLLHHDLKRPIGAWTDLRETPAGLEVKGRIAVASRDGADARALVQAGALRGLSVGYHTLRKQMAGDVRELHEVKLHEISLVPIGMNERAVVRSVNTIASVGDLRELLRDHGFGGREAKAMAGAAWRAMGEPRRRGHPHARPLVGRAGQDAAVQRHPALRPHGQAVQRAQDRAGAMRRLMEEIGSPTYLSNGKPRLYSFHGLRKNAACYLAELGLSDTEIGAICGMTPQTVRHYTKRARALTIARGAAEIVTRGDVIPLTGGREQKDTQKSGR